jgi:hypothetical protein
VTRSRKTSRAHLMPRALWDAHSCGAARARSPSDRRPPNALGARTRRQRAISSVPEVCTKSIDACQGAFQRLPAMRTAHGWPAVSQTHGRHSRAVRRVDDSSPSEIRLKLSRARQTIRVSDMSGAEIPDGKDAGVCITFGDARKGTRARSHRCGGGDLDGASRCSSRPEAEVTQARPELGAYRTPPVVFS